MYKELAHPGFYVYGAACGGRFVGWIEMMYVPKIGLWNKGVIYVDELWVAPGFRRKGIAQQLMKKVFNYQRESGAVEVRLYTEEANIAAQELYKKCGLKESGKAVYMTSGKL